MSGFLNLFEPEETIGRAWHRLVGAAASMPRFPQAGVDLASLKAPLSVYFRGLGGPAGLAVAPAVAQTSRHRLSQRLKLALGEEKIDAARRDRNALYLPARIEAFEDPALNRALYFWLAAFFSHLPLTANDADPLRRDLVFLRAARRASGAARAANPGLAPMHAQLCAQLLRMRPARRLPPEELAVEQAVCALLGAQTEPGKYWAFICGDADLALPAAPANYRPFLPVPLWGEALDDGVAESATPESAPAPQGAADESRDERVRKARRRADDQIQRRDSLILNRFEKALTLIEALNINRAVDDDDEAGAKKALEGAEEIGLSTISKRPSTRLRVDLDLPSPEAGGAALSGEFTYPEWDYAKRAYHEAHCRVIAGIAPETGEDWRPDGAAKARISRVRRQFEALRPRPVIERGAIDGAELDLEALVRARADFRASGAGSDRIYCARRRAARDLSVAFLVDVSLSTDSWIANRRVLDIEKEAVLTLAHGLSACGDDHGIFTFSSKTRRDVRVDAVKDFDEAFGPRVAKRVASLKPQHYTRLGAAMRHMLMRLEERPNAHRLLLVLTDGKPNDVDHYEGRYGVEDARRVVLEAHRGGVVVFGITVDMKARDYFPAIFGRGGYAIMGDATRLASALPAIYRRLVAS
ncbi:nitric oxide reductase activation protein NorD [Methylocystis parvus]|uniref:nitric oxide reductase activation protein NorD n=1 Tax=Methylocystis parvus TaxID=134 RepID=UPI003C743018